MEVRALIFLSLVALLSACGRVSQNASWVPLNSTERNRLVVTTTDFTTGKLAIVDLTGAKSRMDVPIHSDAIVRAPFGSSVAYVVNRLGGDNIQTVVKATGAIASQFSAGSGTNVQDIVVTASNVGYVSRLASASVLKMNLSTGTTLATVSGFDPDADGLPELAWSTQLGNQLFIAQQRLSPSFAPTSHSALGVIDLANDAVTNLNLARTNPVSEIRVYQGELYLAEEALLGVQDGAIERIHPTTHASQIVIEESELGGDLVDFDILSPTLGIAVVGTTKTTLVSFNPTTGKKGREILASSGYTFFHVLGDTTRGVFYLGDGDKQRPSIRVFDATTLAEKVDSRIDLPLPPYHFELTN